MTISAARLAANQRNAAQSTGPKTAAGKARSRTNAVKHGLRALVVPVDDQATVRARTLGVIETIRPQNEFQGWLCVRMAHSSIQLDRLKVMERAARAAAADRAEHSWDEDQRTEADRIARGLPRDPSGTVGHLRQSVAGCDWLIDRWARLADAAEHQEWTDEQKGLAHDLIGTPPEFRATDPTYLVNEQGRAVDPAPTEAQLAHAHLDELRQHRDELTDADEVARALAMADLNDFANRDLQRYRRYDRLHLTDLNRAFAMAQHESPHTVTDPRSLKSIPAHFFDEPPAPPHEPTIPAPNESKVVAPNEPKNAATQTPNEPTIPAPNEPKVVATAAPNEPKPAPDRRPPRPASGIHPELLALLEADLPDPDTLDPAWCREFIAANLGIDPCRLGSPPGSPAPLDRGSLDHERSEV